jgi:predicted RecB family endonuclease
MVLVSTGKVGRDEKENEYKELYTELTGYFKEFNIQNPNPFRTLEEFYGYYRMKFPTYQERRDFVNSLYRDVENKISAILPATPLEEIALSGLMKLGYKMVENTIATPSGYSIDFVMEHNGKLVGVEVKAREVKLSDLRGAIDVRSELGLSNFMVVSSKEFQPETLEFAKKHGINLATTEDILREVERANLPTVELEKGISNLMHFVREQPKPQEKLLKEFEAMLEACLSAKTNDEKKKTLETLGTMLIEMIEGLSVIETNVNTKTEEIDILVKNESKDPFWQRLPTPFLVECKNWSKPVGAAEIRNFDGKMKEIRFRIMIAINGITGKSERENARGVIRDARKEGRIILVLDKKDLEDIAKEAHPAEKINAKFYELYKL